MTGQVRSLGELLDGFRIYLEARDNARKKGERFDFTKLDATIRDILSQHWDEFFRVNGSIKFAAGSPRSWNTEHAMLEFRYCRLFVNISTEKFELAVGDKIAQKVQEKMMNIYDVNAYRVEFRTYAVPAALELFDLIARGNNVWHQNSNMVLKAVQGDSNAQMIVKLSEEYDSSIFGVTFHPGKATLQFRGDENLSLIWGEDGSITVIGSISGLKDESQQKVIDFIGRQENDFNIYYAKLTSYLGDYVVDHWVTNPTNDHLMVGVAYLISQVPSLYADIEKWGIPVDREMTIDGKGGVYLINQTGDWTAGQWLPSKEEDLRFGGFDSPIEALSHLAEEILGIELFPLPADSGTWIPNGNRPVQPLS